MAAGSWPSARIPRERSTCGSYPWPGGGIRVPPTVCWWSDRGDELLVGNQKNEVFSIPVTTGSAIQLDSPRRLFTVTPPSFLVDIATGEQRFLTGSFDPRSSHSTLDVVLGWPRLLDKQ